jgi:hypothetical protein
LQQNEATSSPIDWNQSQKWNLCFRQVLLGHYGAAHLATWERRMNNIIWLVGAVVIVLAILGFFGLR